MTLVSHFRVRVPGRAMVAAGLIFLLLSSFAWAGGKKQDDAPQVDLSQLVWPQPPDEPRLRFVRQFYGEMDFVGQKKKKESGFLAKMAGVTVEAEERPMLRSPYGVAIDSRGRAYVSDTSLHLIFVFDMEKKTLEFRGDKAPANFALPLGLAVDDQDRVFVSDAKLRQITVFGPGGDVVGMFGNDKLERPVGLAVDNALRRLYVVDVPGSHLAVYDLDSFKFLRWIAGPPKGGMGPLANPSGVALDPDGLIYVTDAFMARIAVFDSDGNFVRFLGKRGDGAGMFARPKGIAIDSDGHIYIADAQTSRLQVLLPDGTPLLALGAFGEMQGQWLLMEGMAFDRHNRLFSIDGLNGRVQIFQYVTDGEVAAKNKGKSGEQPVAKKP
jgi:DNA-binding beta-propeller fold protein YncE